ncbi:peptidylprolyl isomerase [Candidatus Woesearchaeota archaeon]|nr:peptidylprolyl isomerase [Candidatus Woesearchaeota archaeon]
MAFKEGDWIRLDYTGKLSDGKVFDTTVKDIAEKEGLSGTRDSAPVIICLGERMLLPGLDAAIIGKEKGDLTITLKPEDAFGKKDPKLLQVIPTPQLVKQGIRPQTGMELNIDGKYGIVRMTGGGRTTVDFNHPIASQEVTYELKIIEQVTDAKDEIGAILDMLGIPRKNLSVNNKEATIKFKDILPKPYLDRLTEHITRLTSIETVHYEAGEQKNKK